MPDHVIATFYLTAGTTAWALCMRECCQVSPRVLNSGTHFIVILQLPPQHRKKIWRPFRLVDKKRKHDVQYIPVKEGRGWSMNVLQMDDSIEERVSREDAEVSTERSVVEAEEKELRNLGADMLGEVFSYLPQKDHFEVLSVSKDWKKAVMEGSGLWRQVDVCRKWNLGGEGRDMRENEILRRVIGFAEDVTFSEAFRRNNKHVMSVGGWLAPNLRILNLPYECILPTFFPLLVSKCPLLESLVVEGTLALGNDPFPIHHPNLKSLKFSGCLPQVLSVDCPALTHLSTHTGEFDCTMIWYKTKLYAPSLFCPRLKSLYLSRFYCAKGVLEAVAAHAPNITSLDASITVESPFTILTNFKALRVLKIRQCGGGGSLSSNAFTSWPLLESLRLDGHDFANDIEVAHVGLKSLEICDSYGAMSPVLSCISLEHLKLSCEILEARCLKNLDQSCPKLKRLEIAQCLESGGLDGRMIESIDEDEVDGPLEIFHERLEELRLQGISRDSVRVACTNLKKLVMM